MGNEKSREYPLASKYSEEQIDALLERERRGELTVDEAIALQDDIRRASAKSALAAAERKNANNRVDRLFLSDRHASAQARVSATLPTINSLLKDGVRKGNSRRRATANAALSNKEKGRQTVKRIEDEWRRLSHLWSHNRASQIALKLGLSPAHVRRVLKKANIT